jgi:Asp-tRNA(Asn)/Glu-tRNA(Gln) amidotransferase C subunit
MVRKKYSEEGALNQKINALFEYRKLNELLRLGQLDQNKKFIDHLVHIQTQIYKLDAYLESHWKLEEEELNRYWDGIQSSLEALGYEIKEHPELLKDIRRYERIEQQCRADQWPTKVSFKKFYTTKSCDVRLIRHLIYAAAPVLKEHWKESIWTYYDLITEINDDVADLEEDLQTYNGNRFLISILRKGKQKTEKSYRKFIQKATENAEQYFKKHPKQEQHHELHDWIISRSEETLTLLEMTMNHSDIEHLSSALVLQHMK